MSETDAAASVLSPAGEHTDSNSTQTDDDMTDAEEHEEHHTHLQMQPQLFHVPPMQTKGKRYIPPKADANTFATQQEFLDSLQPIKLEQVDEDKRKCPVCWKKFGEDPDPGFDNSELPVQLKCFHVFGNKCLASLFRIPETTHFDLEPFSVAPGKRGYLLGEKLLSYRQKHEFDGRDEVEVFQDMIKESSHRKAGLEIFGQYWLPIIIDITHTSGSYGEMSGITFMENAVIMDFDIPKNPGSMDDEFQQLLSGSEHDLILEYPGGLYPMPTLSYLPPSIPLPTEPQQSTNAVSSSSSSSSSVIEQSPVVASSSSIEQSTKLASSSASEQSTSSKSSPEKVESGPDETWQTALAKETNLDKLSALMKQKAGKPGFAEIKAKYKALKGQAKQEKIYQERERRIAEALERKAQSVRKLLATRLSQVLATHTSNRPDRPQLATSDCQPILLRIPLAVQESDAEKASHMISPPMGLYAFGNGDGDESDEEEVLSLERYTVMLMRSCIGGGTLSGNHSHVTPKELTWQSDKKIPDDCPVCHSVLFKRAGVHRSF